MLTEDESRHSTDESVEAIDALELALLIAVAHRLTTAGEGNETAAGTTLMIGLNQITERHRKKVLKAVEHDLEGTALLNAINEDIPDRATFDWAKTEAGKVAKGAYRDALGSVDQIMDGMRESARQGYYQAARYAARVAPRIGYEAALSSAVTELARNGITAYSYVRKDGVTVNVPSDVGIRRELVRAGKEWFERQQDDLAKRLGANYYDVSFCPDARVSHAAWEGKRYQIKGSDRYPNFAEACHVGDLVDGYGGYNCHHSRRLVKNPNAAFGWKDPLEGTGYTNEQVRELTTRQRRLENEIRKEKRVREVLKAEGLPTKESTRKIQGYQKRLRTLIDENSKVLHRNRWRERIYEHSLKKIDDRIFLTYLNPDQVGNINSMREATDKWKKRVTFDRVKGTKNNAWSRSVRYKTSQEEIDSILVNELADVRFTVHPMYNPRIADNGRTIIKLDPVMGRSIDAILIGRQSKQGKRFLIDTLLHEELEARIALREGIMDKASETVRHAYIQKIIDRFMRMKEL